MAGVAFWVSPKGLFVAAACALWNPAGIPLMAAGFAAVSGALAGWLWGSGRAGRLLGGGLEMGPALRRQTFVEYATAQRDGAYAELDRDFMRPW